MAEDLPEAARNLLQSIDFQLNDITIWGDPSDGDEEYALSQQREHLEAWKREIIANPESVTPVTAIKREASAIAENDNEDVAEEGDAPKVKKAKVSQTAECSTCYDDFSKTQTVRLKCCKIRYCHFCFRAWFIAALDSKQLPKCCDIGIEPKDYTRHLNAEIKKKYRAVTTEINAERRLWCSNPACRVFIKIDQDASGFVQCTRCRRMTCASCSQDSKSHKGRKKACASYLTDDALNEAVLKENQLKRCPRCHVPVFRSGGCKNITCQCGVISCHTCGISKDSETSSCRCDNPRMIVNEIVEDPTGDDWEPSAVRSESTPLDDNKPMLIVLNDLHVEERADQRLQLVPARRRSISRPARRRIRLAATR